MTDKNKSNLPTANSATSLQQFSFFNPEQFETMQRVANMFASSELVPDMYRISANNPKEKAVSNCIIAIDIANRIGANILMVMQNMTPIYGKPSWSSKFLIATVNTCGRFEPLQYEYKDLGEKTNVSYIDYEWRNKKKVPVNKVVEGPVQNLQCIAYTTKKGSNERLESAPVSIEMAINERWYTKAGSKWTTMPKLMLMYRAASFWTSVYAPDLSMGMKTVEEQMDVIDLDDKDYQVIPNSEKEAIVEEEIKENANQEEVDLNKTETKEEEVEEEKPSHDLSKLD